MSSTALALALGAAVLHALWNLLLAGSRDMLAATAVAVAASVVVAARRRAHVGRRARGAAVLVASAALELVYFFALAAAYARADLSLVYPVARGGAPVLVLLGALAPATSRARPRRGVSRSRRASCSCAGSRGGDRARASCSAS